MLDLNLVKLSGPCLPLSVPLPTHINWNLDLLSLRKGDPWKCYYGIVKPDLPGNTRTSWINNKSKVLHQIHKIVTSEATKLQLKEDNLGKCEPCTNEKVISSTTGIILKNLDNLFYPSGFHMVLDSANYRLSNPEWTKYFPAFKSGTQAFHELPILLNLYYKMYSDIKAMNNGATEDSSKLSIGHLVLVKLVPQEACVALKQEVERLKKPLNNKNGYYQIHRGCIQEHLQSENKFRVILIDFGISFVVPESYVISMPRPFHLIAPLAIKCSLHGVSPLGGINWSHKTLLTMSNVLEYATDSIFTVNIIKPTFYNPFRLRSLLVSINIHRFSTQNHETRLEYLESLNRFLIELDTSAQWNLFPSRPQLMDQGYNLKPLGSVGIERSTVSYTDALLLAPSTRNYSLFLSVLDREVRKMLRYNHELPYSLMGEIAGLELYLAVRLPGDDTLLSTPIFPENYEIEAK